MKVDVAGHGSMLTAMPMKGDPLQLIKNHRVLVVAGAGGVGKTTMSAALAALAAQAGRRTLCLTIDPARRLAQAFGALDYSSRELDVSQKVFPSALPGRGSLSLMMLDPRETFDEVVQSGLTSPDVARRVLSHRVYDHLAQNLAGTQAYMAMEKVSAVAHDPRWDLIVLDTPPSARVLDFFDAPGKMAQILDSPATRALVTALRSGSGVRPGIVGVGMKAALSGMQRVTGSRMLSDVAELVASMNQLLGGFAERAGRLETEMKSADYGYLLVTSPDATVTSDVRELALSMERRQLRLDALICNRISIGLSELRTRGERELASLTEDLLVLDLEEDLRERLGQACRYESLRRRRQLELCRDLVQSIQPNGSAPYVSYVRELAPSADHRVLDFSRALLEGFSLHQSSKA